jgi:hypothetical protein
LTVFGDTILKLISASGVDKNGTISLRSTSDLVFNGIAVSGSIDGLEVGRISVNGYKMSIVTHSYRVSGGFQLPESDVDGDTTFTLRFQPVENPSYAG